MSIHPLSLSNIKFEGMLKVLDIIRFVGEGLRAPYKETILSYHPNKVVESKGNASDYGSWLINSFLAMGLVLNVYPQLDAVIAEEKRFEKALTRIIDSFAPEEVFLRIDKENDNTLKLVESERNGMPETIQEYLIQELLRQYSTDPQIKEQIIKLCNKKKLPFNGLIKG